MKVTEIIETYFKVHTYAKRQMEEITGSCWVNIIQVSTKLLDDGITFDDIKNMIGSIHLDFDNKDI